MRRRLLVGMLERQHFSMEGNNTNLQPGGGGKVSPRKSVVQSACQYDVMSSVGDF